jgi:hypothetical protein
MRKLLLVSATLLCATSALACSFQAGTGSGSRTPQRGGQPPATGAAEPAQPGQAPGGKPGAATMTKMPSVTGPPVRAIGRVTPKPAQPPGTSPETPPPAQPTPPGVPTLKGSNAFGSGTGGASSFKGIVFWIPDGTKRLPPIESRVPAGVLYASQLDVSSRAFTEGFPGIDANRKENFAIRYEAPLVVDNPGDYELRIVSDDGAVVSIGGAVIVDNDTDHQAAGKAGPVHLVQGTHMLTVDYFQAKGNVALQLFCKKEGEAEKICPTHL